MPSLGNFTLLTNAPSPARIYPMPSLLYIPTAVSTIQRAVRKLVGYLAKTVQDTYDARCTKQKPVCATGPVTSVSLVNAQPASAAGSTPRIKAQPPRQTLTGRAIFFLCQRQVGLHFNLSSREHLASCAAYMSARIPRSLTASPSRRPPIVI